MHSKQKHLVERFIGLFIVSALLFAVATASGCGKTPQQKIIGKWAFNNSKDFFYTFAENGEVVTSGGGMPDKKQKYRLINNETLEMQPAEGEKDTVKISFADNDNTLNITNESGTKHTLKRQ